MAYEKTSAANFGQLEGESPTVHSDSVTPERPWDASRAHGVNAVAADTVREAGRFGSDNGPSGLVLETRGKQGTEYPVRRHVQHYRGITGLVWANAVEAILDRPAHHAVATPAEIDKAWAAVTKAVEAANAAEQASAALFHEAKAAPPREADWEGVERAESDANRLLGKAKAQRAAYDALVPAHLDGDGAWSQAVSEAVGPAHANAVAALAAAEDAVAGFEAAVQAALAAGQARGEEAANLPNLRPVSEALGTAATQLSAMDPAQPVTESKLPVWNRKEREQISAIGSYDQRYRLWKLEQSEVWKHTQHMKGFRPDRSLLADRNV